MDGLIKIYNNTRCWLLLLFCFLFSSYAAAATCAGGWVTLLGSYYNGTVATPVTGTATGTRADTNINFDWGIGTPGVTGVGADNFSVRWDGTIRPLVSGNYKFQTTTDDGVKLYVNGALVINDWNGHVATSNTTSNIALVAGKLYTIKMEYFDSSLSASAVLKWQQPGDTEYTLIPSVIASPDTSSTCTCSNALIGGAVGSYFNNITLTAPAANSHLDATLDFNWGTGTPGVTGIGADAFSVRWNGTFRVSTTGTYTFQTTVDDGVRLYVSDMVTPVINSWMANSAVTYTSSGIVLTAGTDYPIRLEYYEGLITALIKLQWKLGSGSYTSMTSCPVPVVDHYGISLSSPGVTCAGSAITISAYDSSNALIAPTPGTVVTLSTSPATGTWVGGNTYTFAGAESSFVKYLQQTTASTLNINVTDGTSTESASLDPDITFANSALTFYGSAGLGAMPNEVAGTADVNPILKAGNCTSQVSGVKNVSFGYECRNPTTCVAGQTLSINSNNIQSNNNGATITYSAAQSLSFTSGVASIPLNYSDVGKVKIYATMTIPASGNDPAFTLTGNSGDIVVKPYTLVASAVQTAGAVANPGGTSTSGTASDFVAAGDAFTVKVEARNSAGSRTPNFGNETPTENNITFVPQALIYPSGGTLTSLTNAAAFTSTTPAGTFIDSTISWNQVGSFTARPELADNDYLGAGDLVSKTTSGTIGRFYPDHFTLASSSTSNSCSTFSYLSQPAISLNYVLQAKSSSNTTVTNYGSTYGTTQAAVNYVAENNNSADGAIYTSRLSDGTTTTWSSGVLTVASTAASVLRKLTTSAPDGPFTSLQWGVDVTESFDGGRSLTGKNMNALTTGTCSGGGCTAVSIGSPLVLRYGRLRLDSASGAETTKLPVNFLTEYWTGMSFALNASDSCTVVSRSAITYPGGTLATDANRTVPLSSGTTTGTYNNIDASGVHFNAGTAAHYFTMPSAAGTGSFVVGINLSAMTWLRYDWNQDGNYADTTIPNATYSFGSYRGNDRILYWHEKM